jgi:hypothetical protein
LQRSLWYVLSHSSCLANCWRLRLGLPRRRLHRWRALLLRKLTGSILNNCPGGSATIAPSRPIVADLTVPTTAGSTTNSTPARRIRSAAAALDSDIAIGAGCCVVRPKGAWIHRDAAMQHGLEIRPTSQFVCRQPLCQALCANRFFAEWPGHAQRRGKIHGKKRT